IATSAPYFANEASRWTIVQRDGFGRPMATTAPSGACVTMQYGGLTITRTTKAAVNGGPRKTTAFMNERGLPESVVDPNGGTVKYQYDAGDRVTAIAGATGAAVRFEYDEGGKRVKTVDPDTGSWTYEYDGFGQLVRQRDPMRP